MLATLLVLVLMTFKVHATQIRRAHARLEAIAIAERLLSDWAAKDAFPVVGAQQNVSGKEGLSWRIVAVDSNGYQSPIGTAIRLEVITATENRKDHVLASADLVVPGRVYSAAPASSSAATSQSAAGATR
jgi:hypothetical protein